ncbi:MAG: hypothetical protein V1827_04175 [Candidatus Micrarchaeota archaeon]
MDLRYALASLLLLHLSAPAFADCVGYSDSFDVRVLDGSLKAIEGAEVTVKYDRGATFGEKYFTTPVKLTDASGKVHYDIYNGGTLTRPIDCNIVINATAGNASKLQTIVAETHGPTVDVVLSDVFLFRFYVRDQLGAPLTNASVTIMGATDKTDSGGMIVYRLKKGAYDYMASFESASEAGKFTIQNESNYVVIFPHNRISIDVTNDAGDPLEATITIFNDTFVIEGGHYEEARAFGDQVPYVVEYHGLVTEGVIEPAVEPMLVIRYDITSPLIQSITPDFKEGSYKLQIAAMDMNQFASGIDLGSMKAYYRVEPADATVPWSNAVVFTSGRNQFTADFPELPPGRLVKFKIELKDKAGNRAEQEGSFTTTTATPEPDQNDTNPQPPPPQDQGIPLIYIIGGVILIVLAVYLVFRIKSKAVGGA